MGEVKFMADVMHEENPGGGVWLINNKQVWRLIDTGNHSGYYNMAVDEAIAIAVREGRVPATLRFYTWDPPCISIGYFQKPDEKIMSIGEKPGIVRRITGGRAVFHGSDLSYSVVSGIDNILFPDNIKGTYTVIANALIAGLRHLGINPDPPDYYEVKSEKYHRTLLCFNTTLGHEVSVKGRKLIGSAQRRWRDVFLQHGSILVNGSISENGHSSISLKECMPELETFSEEGSLLVTSLSKGFAETLGVQLIQDNLTDYEKELAMKLVSEKYSPL